MNAGRYPDDRMEFAPEIPAEWQHFADLREDLLLNYGYNTARAYWADLQDAFEWAVEREKDVLQLTEKDLRQYIGLHRRRGYSENTIRRRITALRLLYNMAAIAGAHVNTSAIATVIPIRSRT